MNERSQSYSEVLVTGQPLGEYIAHCQDKLKHMSPYPMPPAFAAFIDSNEYRKHIRERMKSYKWGYQFEFPEPYKIDVPGLIEHHQEYSSAVRNYGDLLWLTNLVETRFEQEIPMKNVNPNKYTTHVRFQMEDLIFTCADFFQL